MDSSFSDTVAIVSSHKGWNPMATEYLRLALDIGSFDKSAQRWWKNIVR